MKTATYQVEGEQAAIAAATQLIGRSAWFAVEPRPFGWFAFSIKPGEGNEVFFQAQAATQVAKCPRCKHIYDKTEKHECPTSAYLTARDQLVSEAAEAGEILTREECEQAERRQ